MLVISDYKSVGRTDGQQNRSSSLPWHNAILRTGSLKITVENSIACLTSRCRSSSDMLLCNRIKAYMLMPGYITPLHSNHAAGMVQDVGLILAIQDKILALSTDL